MRESMARLTPQFSANRVVRQYTETYYLPGAAAARRRAADKGALAAELVAWRARLARSWPSLRFGVSTFATEGDRHVFDVQAYLGDLEPRDVRVVLHADATDGLPSVRATMTCAGRLEGSASGWLYRGDVPAARPPGHFTARIVPYHPEAAVPLEASDILWQR
jgi:starch phosphorylase